jgi:hypothetical protein
MMKKLKAILTLRRDINLDVKEKSYKEGDLDVSRIAFINIECLNNVLQTIECLEKGVFDET